MRMRTAPLAALLAAIAVSASAGTDPDPLAYIESALSNKVAETAKETLTLVTARPDGKVTEAIRDVDRLGRELLEVEGDSERILSLNETVVAVIDALKERRIYKYQLWAEGRLEQVLEKLENGKLSASELVKLYLSLGEINASYISENMLNREIMSAMATIYDKLDPENKKRTRQLSVQQQADLFSPIQNLQRRRTPDEF